MNELMLRRRAMMSARSEPVSNILMMPFILAKTIIDMSSGAASRNASWYATDFIELPSGYATVSFTNTVSSSRSFRGAFYDSTRGFVSSGLSAIWTINPGKTGTINIPPAAKYIRLSTNATGLFNQTVEFILGT